MTVAALPSVAEYLEDGVTTSFPAPFRFKAASDLVVERIAGGAVDTLSLGVDYSVAGGATDAGGTVTRTGASAGAKLRIRRRTARTQPMVYTTGDRFPAISHEEALDRQMLIAQEQDAGLADVGARALQVPPGEIAPTLPPRAERVGFAAWDIASGSLVGVAILGGIQGALPIICVSRVLLAAVVLPQEGQPAMMTEPGREGWFVWRGGNMSALINADPGQGIAVAPLLAPSGILGAWLRVFTGDVSPLWFGGKGDGVADDTTALQRSGDMATRLGRFLDVTVPPVHWRISREVDWTRLPGIKAVFDRHIWVDVTGVYPRGFAVLFGDPSVDGFNGRSDKLQLIGNLSLSASARVPAIGGVIFKGSFCNIGSVYSLNFGRNGVRFDSVWDSWVDRISVQRCGGLTDYALQLASTGDTTNATHIGSVQCEEAYQKGVFFNGLRYVVDNWHVERLAILTTNEDGAGNYNNHYFLLSQSQLHQAIFNAVPTGTVAPDGRIAVTDVLHITIAGGASSFSNIYAENADITCDFGDQLMFPNLICRNYTQTAVDHVIIDNPNISGVCTAERGLKLSGGSIGTLLPRFNARDIEVIGTKIAQPINFTNTILGNISLTLCALNGVLSTGNTPAAGYRRTSLVNCSSSTVTGAFGSVGVIDGGEYGAVALASMATLDMRNLDLDSFGYTGNAAYLTTNVRSAVVTSWSPPLNQPYPPGTSTERVGYASGTSSIYRQTSAVVGPTWAPIA